MSARLAKLGGAEYQARRVDASGRIEVRDLRPDEIPVAVGVLARGMRDNPLHVAAYGEDPDRRLRSHARLMRGLFPDPAADMRDPGPHVAGRDRRLAGTCRPTAGQRIRLLPAVIGLGPRTVARVGRWISVWADRDPDEPHVQLGPVAVDVRLQGQGIGSLMMQEHCRRLDSTGDVGYLETDKPENVRFYERFGFAVVGEESVLGVSNWFMRRPPSSSA